jgi:hypothetical protein
MNKCMEFDQTKRPNFQELNDILNEKLIEFNIESNSLSSNINSIKQLNTDENVSINNSSLFITDNDKSVKINVIDDNN